MNLIDTIVLFLVSLVANIFSAFSGGGAGLIQFPALIFLGLTFGIALATHKVASVALGVGAALRHAQESRLEQSLALLILLAGVPGVVFGGLVILHIPERVAEIALGFLTGGLGFYSIFKPNLGLHNKPNHRDVEGMIQGGGVLFLLGILNGSLTSGTGLFVTIWLVRWFGLDYKLAVAYTLILVGLFWNGAGAVTLGIVGNIAWDWLPALLAGSLLGGYIGAHLAITQGSRWIKRAFEVMTLLVAAKLFLG